MSIESLYTSQTSGAGQIRAAGSDARASGAPIQGLNFLDIILARIAAKEESQQGLIASNSDEQALLPDNPNFDIEQIIAKEIESFSLNEQTALSETLALNQEAFNDILKSVEDGTIVIDALGIDAENRTDFPQILETVSIDGEPLSGEGNSKVRDILEKIERLIAAEQANPGLIATNLTPERITSLRQYYERIQSIISEQGQNGAENATDLSDEQAAAGVLVGLIKLVPAQSRPALTPSSADGDKPSGDLLARLNSLINNAPAGIAGEAGAKTAGEERTIQGLPEQDGVDNFEENLKKSINEKAAKASQNAGNEHTKVTAQTKPDLSALQTLLSPLSGSVSATGEWLQELALGGTATNITDTANFTQLVTQAQHASRAHPATQMVAATMQKALGSGTNKSITIQLDPPELGKVEVSMEFGKDKMVKLTVLSEKPETHLMLQRDAQALERALQDSGLDTDGGMNFELANQDHDFNQNGGHDGRNGHGSGQDGENSDEEIELIETTMTWHVDPESGHMRYNILA